MNNQSISLFPLNGLSRVLIGIISLNLLIHLYELGVLYGILPNVFPGSWGGLGSVNWLLRTVTMIVGGIVYAIWVNRAHFNLKASGLPDMEYVPKTGSGLFFGTLIGVLFSIKGIREVWAGSKIDPEDPEQVHTWRADEAPGIVNAWWILLGLSFLAPIFSSFIFSPGNMIFLVMIMIGHLLHFSSGMCLIIIVKEVNSSQEKFSPGIINDTLEKGSGF